ncbi:MAG TPA: dihydroneopterin aldolase [Bacteroidia bacterium]|nr:dihydroneopterin aldolase [Bacteroidia bacterium]
MGKIEVNGIRIRAFHGCLPEEAIIGGEYIVDVIVDADFSKASQSDELVDTIDYCVVYEIVKSEMAIRSKLIEHVAQRILSSLRKKYSGAKNFSVKVTKLVPPMNGAVDSVSVIVEG